MLPGKKDFAKRQKPLPLITQIITDNFLKNLCKSVKSVAGFLIGLFFAPDLELSLKILFRSTLPGLR